MIHVQLKTFNEELLRHDYESSDEDQDGMLDRIESEYNYFHRTHMYVTGTISVVVNRLRHNIYMMNFEYHKNLREMRRLKKEEEKKMNFISLGADDRRLSRRKTIVNDYPADAEHFSMNFIKNIDLVRDNMGANPKRSTNQVSIMTPIF
jgi:hypothetical protein